MSRPLWPRQTDAAVLLLSRKVNTRQWSVWLHCCPHSTMDSAGRWNNKSSRNSISFDPGSAWYATLFSNVAAASQTARMRRITRLAAILSSTQPFISFFFFFFRFFSLSPLFYLLSFLLLFFFFKIFQLQGLQVTQRHCSLQNYFYWNKMFLRFSFSVRTVKTGFFFFVHRALLISRWEMHTQCEDRLLTRSGFEPTTADTAVQGSTDSHPRP